MLKGSYLFVFSTLILVASTFSNADAGASCSAMDLVKNERWDAAITCSESQKDKLLTKLVLWTKYKNTNSNAQTEEILDFIAQNPNFPNLITLQTIAEKKINKETKAPVLKHWFSKNKPITSNGIRYYLELMDKELDEKALIYWVKQAWIRVEYDKIERKKFLSKYKKYLTHSDHIQKIDYLISNGYTSIDEDVMRLVNKDYKLLFAARLSILRNNGNIDSIIAKVPEKLRTAPGLLYAKAVWHKKRGHYDKVAQLILDHPHMSAIHSDAWFQLRSRTILELEQKKNYKTSYAIASSHKYKEPVNYVDGEWFAGKIAWIYHKDAPKALEHFQRILEKSKYPVSIAKSAYWSGMMHKKMGNQKEANKRFRLAANYPGTFYGQLSILKNQGGKIELVDDVPRVTDADKKWSENSELVNASKILAKSNQHISARLFANAAYKSAHTAGQRYLLTKIGTDEKLPSLAVLYNKASEREGHSFKKRGYPVLDLKSFNKNVEKALSLSIIRQESEFDPYAHSPAGAVGLMQLMYPTAKQLGSEFGDKVTKEILSDSEEENVKLGTYYLSKLLKKYKGSYILTIAAYNAGPRNVDKWIKLYGDPKNFRSQDAAVEWIEKIPFNETRTYVQHVLSNLQIYRTILKDQNENKETAWLHIDFAKDLIAKV